MHALDPSNNKHNPDSGPPKDRLRSAQITQIYSQSLLGSLAATLGGIVFASALWIAEPHPQIIAWIVLYFSTSVAHFVLTKAFRRSKTTAENIVWWGSRHWAVTVAGSLAWTYAVVFLFPTDLHLQIFMIIFVGGIVSGAAAIYSPTREYLTSNVVILMPLAGHFLYLGGGYNSTIGLLLFMFGLVMFVVGNSVHRLYAELLSIRFEREDLIDDLTDQISVRKQVETDLREARDALELRVAERTAELREKNLALSEEIAERRKVEDALRASEDAYRSLSENIPGVVYRIWPDREEVRFFGTGLELLTGLEKSDISYTGATAIHQLILPEDIEDTVSFLKKALSKQTPFQLSYRIRRKNGETRWFSDHGRFDCSHGGSVSHIDGVIFDVTERKIAEEVVRQSEERYRLLFNNAQEAIIVIQENRLKFWNPATVDLLGFSSGELSGILFADLIHPEDRATVLVMTGKRLSDESASDAYSFRIVGKEGRVLWVQSNTVLLDWEGAPATLNFLTNITDLKKAEDFTVRMERLKAIGDLASGVAHNFNNLLQVVMAGVELALNQLDEENSDNIRKSLERIRESSKLGSETVKRLQRFAKIRVETPSGDRGLVDLSEIARQSVDITQPFWEANPGKQGLSVEMDVSLTECCFVEASESELVEVVINLIKNAAEAMPNGGRIGIKTFIAGDQVILEVRDNGIGISDDAAERLFEAYWTTKGAEGTGMGLAVSRQIVIGHGGTISVVSKVGKGSTFRIQLPLAEIASQEARPAVSQAPDLSLRILVIDDTEPLAFFLHELLSAFGNQVLCATSGEKGVELFRDNQIDLIICDLGMPEMNGWEVGRRIRSICANKGISKTPFILLTGWGGQSLEPDKMVQSGIDAVLEKPVETAKLFSVMQQVVSCSSKGQRASYL